MSTWSPISDKQPLTFIEQGTPSLSEEEYRFFEMIKIPLQKWQLPPWGDQGGGFWVLGVFGSIVLWYNDIEEGFNFSFYSVTGQIGKYWCNQDDFDIFIKRVYKYFQTGIINYHEPI